MAPRHMNYTGAQYILTSSFLGHHYPNICVGNLGLSLGDDFVNIIFTIGCKESHMTFLPQFMIAITSLFGKRVYIYHYYL